MIIIEDVLISDDILEKQFICNLKACKGACCWEGDYGAPLTDEELVTLDKIYEDIKPFLSPLGVKAIEEKGKYVFYIEAAYNAGVTDFKKPISCHLYPIRVSANKKTGFEALNYDQWDICSAACALGEKEQVPVYQFLKEPIIRKYGEDFYEQMEGAAAYLENPDVEM